jgi:hypothetical protein
MTQSNVGRVVLRGGFVFDGSGADGDVLAWSFVWGHRAARRADPDGGDLAA